ncbi:PAAR domain-containing protein [Hafnia alvei]|uniref:PAAR domain-containing protein n=1 Tax=Hafnia alvei TaxID=569 RepID=A0ABD7Q5Q5_HAFAL|nr:PAAR domain-containing protein [Hafnia alvei]TBL66601.1 PAAR domain-containing protein [Hafnia alvei]
MSQKGYFIRVGDKTSCGGTVRGGNPNYNMHGRAASRHGDLVTCGKDGKTYRIIGGIPGMLDNNVQLAGTLDSISSCPCRAKLLSSLSSATYEKTSRAKTRMATTAQPAAPAQYAQAAKATPRPLNNLVGTIGGTCEKEDDPLANGVFVWTETHEAGHAFISVHINSEVFVFTYGRFARTAFVGLVGDGILNYLIDDDAIAYYVTELYKMSARVFRIDDAGIQLTKQLFEARWNAGKSVENLKEAKDITKRRGRIIDTYDLTGSNCATHSVTVLRQAGSKIFGTSYTPMTTQFPIEGEEDFSIPISLQNFLEKMSLSLSSMNVLEVTSKFKSKYENITAMSEIEDTTRGKFLHYGTGSMSEAGSLSGYSGGTVDGILGGSYNVD